LDEFELNGMFMYGMM